MNKNSASEELTISSIDRHVANGILIVLAAFIEVYNVFLDTMADQTVRIINNLRDL